MGREFVLTKLLSLLGVGAVKALTQNAQEAYETYINAANDKDRIAAEERMYLINARLEILKVEQRSRMTSWIRPAIAFPVVVLIWKLVLWDTVLGLGVTPYPGDLVKWLMLTVVGAYLLTRPFGSK